MNPNNSKEIKRLRQAMEWSRKKMNPFRVNHQRAVREFVGKHYGENGSRARVPVNLLELAISIYVRQLASKPPQILCRTTDRSLRHKASVFQLRLNQLLKDIDFARTFQLLVTEAMFSVGIMKVGVTDSGQRIELDGFLHDAGQTFADLVYLDDFCLDMTAKRYERVRYVANQYRRPLSWVKDNEDFHRTVRSLVSATERDMLDEMGDERTETITQGHDAHEGDLTDYVDLWDIWLPEEGLYIVDLVQPGYADKPLLVKEWKGPETGPYQFLSFGDVSGNLMPLAPVAILQDLHELANRIWNKLGRQSDRQKTVTGVRGPAKDDGDRVIDANDGEMILMDDPDGVREFSYGGIDQPSLAFGLQVKDMFSYLGGNLDSLGGLSPMADTLGQEEILGASASQRLIFMEGRVVQCATQVSKAMAEYEWADPVSDYEVEMPLPGLEDTKIKVVLTAGDRQGKFLLNVDIEPNSMTYESPGARLRSMMTIFERFIAPYVELLKEQGITINFEELMRIISNYGNLPELRNILKFMRPADFTGQGTLHERTKAPNTTRTNVRVNRPGASRFGKENALSQQLLGGKVQPKEAAAITRPTG